MSPLAFRFAWFSFRYPLVVLFIDNFCLLVALSASLVVDGLRLAVALCASPGESSIARGPWSCSALISEVFNGFRLSPRNALDFELTFPTSSPV